MQFHIKIFDRDPVVVDEFRHAFARVPSVSVQHVESGPPEPPAGLDVLYMSLPAAEPFGSKPVWHESLILTVPAEYQQRGMPPFVVTGTGLLPHDARGPEPELRLVLNCVFDAIKRFNAREETKLERIGFWAFSLREHLYRPALSAVHVRDLLLSVVAELAQSTTL